MDDYEEARLRKASPDKCKHWITEIQSDVSYGTRYWWTLCKVCGAEYDRGSQVLD